MQQQPGSVGAACMEAALASGAMGPKASRCVAAAHCGLQQAGVLQYMQNVSGLLPCRLFSPLFWFTLLQQLFKRHLPTGTSSRQPKPVQSQRPSVASDAHFLQQRTPQMPLAVGLASADPIGTSRLQRTSKNLAHKPINQQSGKYFLIHKYFVTRNC